MADDGGVPGRSGEAGPGRWAPPQEGRAPGGGEAGGSEEAREQAAADRRGNSLHEQPTIASGGEVPPPVPPAPGAAGPGPGPGPGSGSGSGGHGASPYAAASPYGRYGAQGGAGFNRPSPPPPPFGYGAGPGPGGAGYGWPGPPPSNGKSVAAMVLGIIGLVAAVTCWGSFLGVFISPVALGLGLSAKRGADRGETGGRGQAVSGFVMGIVGTVLSVLIVAFLLIMMIVHGPPGDRDSGPGSGDGSSLDAHAPSQVLPGAADRGI